MLNWIKKKIFGTVFVTTTRPDSIELGCSGKRIKLYVDLTGDSMESIYRRIWIAVMCAKYGLSEIDKAGELLSAEKEERKTVSKVVKKIKKDK